MKTYRSSSTTFFYRYLFTLVWGGMFLFGIIFTSFMNNPSIQNWLKVAVLIASWALIWQIILIIRLRSVEANDKYLIVKTFRGEKLVSYKDIEYVSQIAMTSPVLISIKYYDHETGESKKILIIPALNNQMLRLNFTEELEMTKFLRGQVIKANPYYNSYTEPLRWLPFVVMLFSGMVLALIVQPSLM